MVRVCDKLVNLTDVVDKNSDKIFPPVSEKEEHKVENHVLAAVAPAASPLHIVPAAHVVVPPPMDEEDNVGNR